jgi:hypothetical protein
MSDDSLRFPADVEWALSRMGWQPGRDVRDQIARWLSPQRLGELRALPFERDGYRAYQPFPAALAALSEFGGITSLDSGPGRTSARVPFRIFPTRPDDDLFTYAVDAVLLGARLGRATFQIGDVERGRGALVIDETGEVFVVGPAQLYAGKTIDEALIRFLQGIYCEELREVGY